MRITKTGKASPFKGKKRPKEIGEKISEAKKGKIRKPSKYGGYIKTRSDGYRQVFVPNHPNKNKDGLVMEHILIMEEKLGRYLNSDECVHHIDHNRSNNDISNLQLLSKKEHAKLHAIERHKEKRKF